MGTQSFRKSRSVWSAWSLLPLFLFAMGLASATAEEAQFVSKGVKLHYCIEGKGPPVLLIHGMTLDAKSQWTTPGITEALAKNYRVIALDCRGHGKSDKPHEPAAYGIEMVNDVTRLLDHLKIKKINIVGYSLGGTIALKFAAMHPNRCETVVLAENAIYDEHYDFSAENKASQNTAAVSDPAEVMPKLPPETPAEIVNRRDAWVAMPHDFKAYAAIFQTLNALKITHDEVRQIDVPVLGIYCKSDARAMFLSAHLPNFKPSFVGGTHLDAFYRPQFLSSLTQFLQAHTKHNGH